MGRKVQHDLKEGDRVTVVATHRRMPGRYGIVKKVQVRVGNRFLVQFEPDELGVWHGEDGEPVLRLGEDDLVLVEESQNLAA